MAPWLGGVNVPDTVTSLRDRLPAAADTWACPATVAMADSSIVAVPGATDSRSWVTLVDVVSPAPKSKRPARGAAALAAWVPW